MSPLFNNKRSFLIIGLGFLGAGIIYWTIPYGQVDMLNRQFIFKWSIPAIIVGIMASSLMKKHPLPASLMITIGFIAAVMARLMYDTTIDPTTHNLWPFEVIVAILVSFPASFIGATIPHFFRRKINPHP